MIVLSGDIGGTNTRLQLSQYLMGRLDVVATEKYYNNEHPSLDHIIEQFLLKYRKEKANLYAACMAVAGPIVDGAAALTNLPWTVSEEKLRTSLSIDKVKLINDFQAIGYGVDTLESEDLYVLQKGRYEAHGLQALIGAGTGLGVGLVFHSEGHSYFAPTEGGHVDFAPVDDDQVALLQYMRKRRHRVSAERFVSGQGIVNIYDFIRNNPLPFEKENEDLKFAMHNEDPAAAISKFAIQHQDPMALRTIDFFIKIYGAVVGNLALTTLPRGGLYIVGGIAPKLLKQMCDGRFMAAFGDKGRMSNLLRDIPLHIVLNTQVGLQGASICAARL